jgi:hypothetical protein
VVWKLDRFGRNLLHCLSCIEELQEIGIRFIAVTQGLDVDRRNPASKFLLHVLAAAAEFERSLILERTAAGKACYRQDYEQGLVGKTVHSRSGRDLPPHSPKKIFNRDSVLKLRPGFLAAQDCSTARHRAWNSCSVAARAFQKSLADCLERWLAMLNKNRRTPTGPDPFPARRLHHERHKWWIATTAMW